MNINLYNLYTKYPRWNLQYENGFEKFEPSLINQLNNHFDDIYSAYLKLVLDENGIVRTGVIANHLFGNQIIMYGNMIPYDLPSKFAASNYGLLQFGLSRIFFVLDKDKTTVEHCSYSFFSYGLLYTSKEVPIEKLAEDMLMYQQYLDNLTKLKIAFNNQYKRFKNFFA